FVLELDFEGLALVLELDRGDFAPGQLRADECLVAVLALVPTGVVDQFHGEERQDHDDQDWERGALEETAHGLFRSPLAPPSVVVTRALGYQGAHARPLPSGPRGGRRRPATGAPCGAPQLSMT